MVKKTVSLAWVRGDVGEVDVRELGVRDVGVAEAWAAAGSPPTYPWHFEVRRERRCDIMTRNLDVVRVGE